MQDPCARRRAARRFAVLLIAVALATGAGGARAGDDGDTPVANGDVPLLVWNRYVTTFRATYQGRTPAARAERAIARIGDLPLDAADRGIAAQPATVGGQHGVLVMVEGTLMFYLLPEDVDPDSGVTVEEEAGLAIERLREILRVRADQLRWTVILRGIAFSLLATVVFGAIVWGVLWLQRFVIDRLVAAAARRTARLGGVRFDLREQIRSAERLAVRTATGTTLFAGSYFWLTTVLLQFPYTQPWGQQLGRFVLGVLRTLVFDVVGALPNLFVVLVVFLGARAAVRLLQTVFRRVASGALRVRWLEPETARATEWVSVVLVWVAALLVAYPYIPGSQTQAFKGVGVLLGFMVSLGSSGMINQVMSGLAVVYARVFRPGDWVRVGEIEGAVSAVGLLATKIVTARREEVTIPNAVLVATVTTNFDRVAGRDGAVLTTTVTIGYDTPWRQVHAMLERAAGRTGGLRATPAPWVAQRALSDHYVEYQLLAHLAPGARRLATLSELHGHIQDVFNEHGVQIMSPHFVAQPTEAVVVPPERWHAPPAAAPER